MTECILVDQECVTNTKIKQEVNASSGCNTTPDSNTQDSDKIDYIESMDVCSNVEIESTEDSIVTGLNSGNAEDVDMTPGWRRKRNQKSKKATSALKMCWIRR